MRTVVLRRHKPNIVPHFAARELLMLYEVKAAGGEGLIREALNG